MLIFICICIPSVYCNVTSAGLDPASVITHSGRCPDLNAQSADHGFVCFFVFCFFVSRSIVYLVQPGSKYVISRAGFCLLFGLFVCWRYGLNAQSLIVLYLYVFVSFVCCFGWFWLFSLTPVITTIQPDRVHYQQSSVFLH